MGTADKVCAAALPSTSRRARRSCARTRRVVHPARARRRVHGRARGRATASIVDGVGGIVGPLGVRASARSTARSRSSPARCRRTMLFSGGAAIGGRRSTTGALIGSNRSTPRSEVGLERRNRGRRQGRRDNARLGSRAARARSCFRGGWRGSKLREDLMRHLATVAPRSRLQRLRGFARVAKQGRSGCGPRCRTGSPADA